MNLLVAFDALVREKSVTRAAERMSVTQSAMSHTLRRLRQLLDDPLLVRGYKGMALTPRAESLIIPIRSGLVMLGRALSQPMTFEPATARRAFRLAAPDLFNMLVIPGLLSEIRQVASHIDIAMVSLNEATLAAELETGELDLAVVPWMDDSDEERSKRASGLMRRRLFHDTFVSYARAEHPATREEAMSLEGFASLSHAMVSPTGEGDGVVDRALAREGLRRRVVVRVPDFFSALSIIAQSDLILTAPGSLVRVLPEDYGVVSFDPPVSLPGHSVNLIWHERFSNDPGHVWLRSTLERASAWPGEEP